jgi:hypothetical protein
VELYGGDVRYRGEVKGWPAKGEVKQGGENWEGIAREVEQEE